MSLAKKKLTKNIGVKLCKLHADNSGSQTDILPISALTATLTKCPPENTGLLLSEISKDPPLSSTEGADP